MLKLVEMVEVFIILALVGWTTSFILLFFDRQRISIVNKSQTLSRELVSLIYESDKSELSLQETANRLIDAFKIRTGAKQIKVFIRPTKKNDEWFQNSENTARFSGLAQQDIRAIHKFLQRVDDNFITSTSVRPLDNEVYRILVSYWIDYVVALKIDQEVVGFIAFRQDKHTDSSEIIELVKLNDVVTAMLLSAQLRDNLVEENARLVHVKRTMSKEAEWSNQQLNRLDEAKEEFISMMSHQLRTPLTSIKGYISLILEGDAGKISSNQKQLLGEAFRSSERMAHTINDFLNVSRLQTGRFVLEREIVDLKDIIKNGVDDLRDTAKISGIKIGVKIPLRIASKMNLDVPKMYQVLGNLLDNALFFSKKNGSVVVKMSEKNDRIYVDVEDDGIGVPESEVGGLFTKFYRATNAKRHRPDGTGIGLYLVKEIILMHGGEAYYEPTKKGSVFGFWLPIDKRLNISKIKVNKS